ncbi:hypothetical protein DFH08DRAFT_821039 [Mycena albidolilacea]|uniref:Uncharacterized protein n=1 Tax=Mycena albidolilacea TaxID=1033008 RepID=A0AAD6ZB09_9AGAR|nr:hypothetical protein DFH08DRAFT_821039 [Mycena albidolilacea]
MPTAKETRQGTPTSGDSPVLVLPSEIATEIFAHCVPAHLDSVGQPDLNAVPLLLDRICSSRHSIAQGSPKLWNVLKLNRAEITAMLIEAWLSHAQALLLTLEVKAREYNWDEDEEWDTVYVIPIFKCHSLTWHEVTLVLCQWLQQLRLNFATTLYIMKINFLCKLL